MGTTTSTVATTMLTGMSIDANIVGRIAEAVAWIVNVDPTTIMHTFVWKLSLFL
jgi:hypothetical protein